jgi:hypothetical protein
MFTLAAFIRVLVKKRKKTTYENIAGLKYFEKGKQQFYSYCIAVPPMGNSTLNPYKTDFENHLCLPSFFVYKRRVLGGG